MGQSSFPFDVEEEEVFNIIRRIVRQYWELGTKRVGLEIKRRLQFCSYNTTSNLSVTALRHGIGRILVYIGATAPDGRPYEAELEVVL